jgi:hypothetical protein
MILIEDRLVGVRAVEPRLRDRLAVRLHADHLDADLARGVSPDRDVRHALRARTLISARTRDELATALDRLSVRGGRAELAALRAVVAGRGPVAVRGMAMVQLLVTDASSGLYPVGAAVAGIDARALLAQACRAVAEVPVVASR